MNSAKFLRTPFFIEPLWWLLTEDFVKVSQTLNKVYLSLNKKFFVKYFFSKCEQIHRRVRLYLHLLKKFLTKTYFYYAGLSKKSWVQYFFRPHFIEAFITYFEVLQILTEAVIHRCFSK